MVEKVIRILLVLLMGLVYFSGMSGVRAQEATWQFILLDSKTGGISTLTPAGLQPGPVFPQMLSLGEISGGEVTPDGHYLVFSARVIVQPNMTSYMYVADLTTGECCRKLEDPLNSVMDLYFRGPISPDGTQVVAALASNQAVYGGTNIVSLVSVFDIATGIVKAATDVSKLKADYGLPQIAGIGEWKSDGIRLIAGCLACEGIWGGRYQIWNPATGTISPPTESFSVFKHKLPATGELVEATLDASYPQSGAMSVYLPPSNVVEYYSNSEQPTGQVIYFNPTNKYINEATWVADGNGIVVNLAGPLELDPTNTTVFPGQGSESYLALRSGSQFPLAANVADVFAATPEGWISRDSAGTILYTQVVNGQLQTAQIATGAGDQIVKSNFMLGAGLLGAASAFPTVPPPTPTVCPGFLPSRLSVNSAGQVTPGASNNLRDQPSTTGTLLTQIPAGGIFIVLAGPTCAENLAWWQVNYSGTIGWTAEGQGTEYWTEPIVAQ